jgi:hypothetical protein
MNRDECVVLMPYFSGDSPEAHSHPRNRPGYLVRTVMSVRPLASRIIIGVRPEDAPFIKKERLGEVAEFDCIPWYIPSNLCRWAQKELPDDIKYVYFTDSDQILYYKDEVLNRVYGNDYLIPHRLEDVAPDGSSGHVIVEFGGKKLAILTGIPEGDGFYYPQGMIPRFAAAFLASRELFNSVNFADSPSLPLEHTNGFDIAATGRTVKTSNWQDFFVDHLSSPDRWS